MNSRHAFALFAVLGLAFACSAPNGGDTIAPALPDQASFPLVGQMLVHRCGSLDCHGMPARNLRIFGNEGMRLAATDRPIVPAATTAEEFNEDYLSLVDLEPEIMSAVVSQAGAAPDRLTFVAKARGEESHKGSALITPGDDQDRCITTWLAGKADTTACTNALDITKYP